MSDKIIKHYFSKLVDFSSKVNINIPTINSNTSPVFTLQQPMYMKIAKNNKVKTGLPIKKPFSFFVFFSSVDIMIIVEKF